MANSDPNKKVYKKGTYFALGLSLGLVFGSIYDNLAMGLALGTAIGLLIDARMAKKASAKPTDQSK